MVSCVGSKVDDLKTCLSPKSTAFLHVGPESRRVSDAIESIQMTSHRVEILSLRQPRILVRVRRHDHCVHVSRENTGSLRDLQLAVMGDRGAAQL